MVKRSFKLVGVQWWLVLVLAVVWGAPIFGQTANRPKEKIPAEMLMQVRELDLAFQNLLRQECPQETCVYRGCVYQRHEVVTMQANRSLPGLSTGTRDQVKGNEPQYFLSRARCEYAYETSLSKDDVANLDRRLAAKLSKGILKVSMKAIPLPDAPRFAAEDLPSQSQTILEKFIEKHFDTGVLALLGLVTILILIWAFRRLGKDSLEDKLRYMQLKKEIESDSGKSEEKPEEQVSLDERISGLRSYFSEDPKRLQNIGRHWLEERNFEALAYTSHVLAKTDLAILPDDLDLIQAKIAFQNYMKREFTYDSVQLESHVKELENQVGTLSAQLDDRTELFHDFFQGSHGKGLADICQSLPADAAATILVLAPDELQREASAYLGENQTYGIALRYLRSPLFSEQDLGDAEQVIRSAMAGEAVQLAPRAHQVDFGVRLTIVEPLSQMMAKMSQDNRDRLWQDARAMNGNRLPNWAAGIFYPEMLDKLDDQQVKALCLECDAKRLAPWFASELDLTRQERLLEIVPESYGKALRSPVFQEMTFSGQTRDLGQALLKLAKRGDVNLDTIL
ncbi:hypothetical protein [Pseudobacteriovorax antillogorgiicola]|uniref:Uncharacterized protein n=1 Tax=Pseudobacteriovorax antillogorgiicola TaxID=1513793 RepID=A0A1Y6CRP2_9BACT|nr:hypothetical protein [Pseudobacteriovorax antillogorgiicola]TCS45907.1 hypothetical protein EDD56_12670 [Pseudobacteriovorax antillogorgiicola]SMF71099.1 hypothetical protein SAMN06296036_12628 [Pseudobacteriovorax antillogorgiicola]